MLVSLAFLIWWSSLPYSSAEQLYGFPSLPASLSTLVQGGDGAFYGTTAGGGSQGYGAVFRVTTNGDLTILVSFAGTNGASPAGGLVRASDGNFYGTTEKGGLLDRGTVFRLTTNGVLRTLLSFEGAFTGAWPHFGLVQGSDGLLYGSTGFGMFRISLEGDFTPVATFGSTGSQSPLVEVGKGIFYGVNTYGGDNGCGSVFQVATNGVVTTLASLNWTNGAYPCGGLVLGPDGALYGTALQGGSGDWGTLFRVTTNGLLTVLFSFQETDNGQGSYIYDGGQPSTGMVLGRDGQLYGTTATGGSNGWGTVFQVTTNGLLRTLASFESDGLLPFPTALVQGTDGAFYGATDNGGPNNIGSVFRVTTNGALTTLFGFTNTEGANPQAGLALGDDGALYGTTPAGGDDNFGAVFRITTNGEVSTLASFNIFDQAGSIPRGALVRANDGMLYGTTSLGDAHDGGTVFRVTTNGVLITLASFGADGTTGAQPYAGLIQGSDGALYGTTYAGGVANCGTVFRATTNGELTTLASFFNTNGAQPSGPLVQGCDGALYGVASSGGPVATNIGGLGTIFRVTTNGVLTALLALDWTNRMAPDAGLVLGDDCALYGTTGGTLFRLTTEGQVTPVASVTSGPLAALSKGPDGAFYATTSSNGCIVICRFSTNGVVTTVTSLEPGAGAQPRGSLVAAPDGFLYGVASQGGSRGGGSIFRARLPDYRPRMRSVQFLCSPGPASYVTVTFTGEPGKIYRVLRATNLSGPWQSLGQATTSPDGLGRWSEAPPPPNGAFYRVATP